MVKKIFILLTLFSMTLGFTGCQKLKTQEDYFNAVIELINNTVIQLDNIEDLIVTYKIEDPSISVEGLGLKDIIESNSEIYSKNNEILNDFQTIFSNKESIVSYKNQINLAISNILQNDQNISDDDFKYVKDEYSKMKKAYEYILTNKQKIESNFYYIENTTLSEISVSIILSKYDEIISYLDKIGNEVNIIKNSSSGFRILFTKYVV